LESTSDLTTEHLLVAIARFLAGRGCPQRVHSDNGKTFEGAVTLLSGVFMQAVQKSVTDAYSIILVYQAKLNRSLVGGNTTWLSSEFE